jgi:hypothetical protein
MNTLPLEFTMEPLPHYSTVFSCIHDEPKPIGRIGNGVHYSVFRAVRWLDLDKRPADASLHDFAMIWDDSHDTRAITTTEEIYMAGLLTPVLFLGQHRDVLTVLVSADFAKSSPDALDRYRRELEKVVENTAHGRVWIAQVGVFDASDPKSPDNQLLDIIHAAEDRAQNYLRNIDSLWKLGQKPFVAEYKRSLWPRLNEFTEF